MEFGGRQQKQVDGTGRILITMEYGMEESINYQMAGAPQLINIEMKSGSNINKRGKERSSQHTSCTVQ